MFQTVTTILVSTAILLARPSLAPSNKVLSEMSYSLTNRHADSYVNNVFSDNILLTLAYINGKAKQGEQVSWEVVKTPGTSQIVLKPGEVFAFHELVLEKYKEKIVATTNAHFNSDDGFKSDGWLVGDGVCHLASFIYVTAKKAGLEIDAPTRHDFAKIPDVEKEDGVSIFYIPNDLGTSMFQNLYITNKFDKTIIIVFTYNTENVNIKIEELN